MNTSVPQTCTLSLSSEAWCVFVEWGVYTLRIAPGKRRCVCAPSRGGWSFCISSHFAVFSPKGKRPDYFIVEFVAPTSGCPHFEPIFFFGTNHALTFFLPDNMSLQHCSCSILELQGRRRLHRWIRSPDTLPVQEGASAVLRACVCSDGRLRVPVH